MKIVKIVLGVIAVLGIIGGCIGFFSYKGRNDECENF